MPTKIMVSLESGPDKVRFDLAMVAAVMIPSPFGKEPNSPATIILMTGAQLQMPVPMANDILAKIDEMSQIESAKVFTGNKQVLDN